MFLSEEEKSSLLSIPYNGDEQHFITLFDDLARTDITSVYRLGEFPLSLCAQPHGIHEEQSWAVPRDLLAWGFAGETTAVIETASKTSAQPGRGGFRYPQELALPHCSLYGSSHPGQLLSHGSLWQMLLSTDPGCRSLATASPLLLSDLWVYIEGDA